MFGLLLVQVSVSSLTGTTILASSGAFESEITVSEPTDKALMISTKLPGAFV